MAFKLSKTEEAQRDKLCTTLQDARIALDEKIEDVNDAMQTARDALEQAVADYNAALEDVRGFVADVVSQSEEDFSDKSERWQEGERGEIARAWIDEWDGALFDDIDLPDIEPIAIDDEGHATVLEELPSEAE